MSAGRQVRGPAGGMPALIWLFAVSMLVSGCSTMAVYGFVCERQGAHGVPVSGCEVTVYRDHGDRLSVAGSAVSEQDGYYLFEVISPGYYAICCSRPQAEDTWVLVRLRPTTDPVRLDLPVAENTAGMAMVDYTERYMRWWQSDLEVPLARLER
ncbi:hypothetical protein JW921_01680 [Candidatus Fermentibacterales bacterium]|nr:hypothetical protein [Candidatus Fermentibacterales bacterium]